MLHFVPSLLSQLPPLKNLVFDALFILAVVALAKALQRFILAYIVLIFPGTLMHELAHFLVGFVSNARPRLPSVLPQRNGQGWQLGSVRLGNARWYNAGITAFAPLLLLPLALWLYLHWVPHFSLWGWRHWLYLYLVVVIFMSALPSKIDVRLAWKYSAGLIFVMLVLAIIYFVWRHGLHF